MGYGLDLAERFRTLEYIGILDEQRGGGGSGGCEGSLPSGRVCYGVVGHYDADRSDAAAAPAAQSTKGSREQVHP